MLAEVQALVTASPAEKPRRTTSGLDSSRMAMVIAVLQQHGGGLQIGTRDVFAATVGGAKLTEPASDLALAVALVSSMLDAPPPQRTVAIGEIGLAGDLRRVRDLDQRLAEAARLGFRTAVVPAEPGEQGSVSERDGLRVIAATSVLGAMNALGMGPARARSDQRS